MQGPVATQAGGRAGGRAGGKAAGQPGQAAGGHAHCTLHTHRQFGVRPVTPCVFSRSADVGASFWGEPPMPLLMMMTKVMGRR